MTRYSTAFSRYPDFEHLPYGEAWWWWWEGMRFLRVDCCWVVICSYFSGALFCIVPQIAVRGLKALCVAIRQECGTIFLHCRF